MTSIVYDGWDLVYRPNSPAAIHLLTMLQVPLNRIQARVAVPGASFHPLPSHVEVIQTPSPPGEWGRLSWEQRDLPALARRVGAAGLHVFTARPPLFSNLLTLVSPAGLFSDRLVEQTAEGPQPWRERLRAALGQGGLSRARGVFWPSDWPMPKVSPPMLPLPRGLAPVFVLSELWQEDGALPLSVDLPESFVLYHGPEQELWLRRLLAAWTWAAGSIGPNYPLLVAGLSQSARRVFQNLIKEFDLLDTVQILPVLSLTELAQLYRRCACLFHPAPLSPWGDAVALALAAGRPVVALETVQSAALVGPAAYLVPDGEQTARLAGAALLTVIVEEQVAEALSNAAQERSRSWRLEMYSSAYENWLQRLLG